MGRVDRVMEERNLLKWVWRRHTNMLVGITQRTRLMSWRQDLEEGKVAGWRGAGLGEEQRSFFLCIRWEDKNLWVSHMFVSLAAGRWGISSHLIISIFSMMYEVRSWKQGKMAHEGLRREEKCHVVSSERGDWIYMESRASFGTCLESKATSSRTAWLTSPGFNTGAQAWWRHSGFSQC